jgi:hypothetical protein
VRIHIKAGDLMTLPEGIYHRFTCDSGNLIHAMRLFKGAPVWTPFNRPQEGHASRAAYESAFTKAPGNARVTTLKYWNGRGLMDPPRMMLALAGKPFQDVRIGDGPGFTPKAEVGDLDANLGRVPVADTTAGI